MGGAGSGDFCFGNAPERIPLEPSVQLPVSGVLERSRPARVSRGVRNVFHPLPPIGCGIGANRTVARAGSSAGVSACADSAAGVLVAVTSASDSCERRRVDFAVATVARTGARGVGVGASGGVVAGTVVVAVDVVLSGADVAEACSGVCSGAGWGPCLALLAGAGAPGRGVGGPGRGWLDRRTCDDVGRATPAARADRSTDVGASATTRPALRMTRAPGAPSRNWSGSSSRIVSPSPILRCTVCIQRGAHQQSSPSSFIVAGTSSMRITVASRMSAAIMPNAMYFIITISDSPNAPVTTTRIAAAAVMMRPVCAVPTRTASVVLAPFCRASTMRESRNIS